MSTWSTVSGRVAGRMIGFALAIGSLAGTIVPQTVPALAADPMKFITDVQVVSGDNAGVACPAGYSKNPQDLNKGSGGKYVYACVQMGTDPKLAIEELYVTVGFPVASNPYVHVDCYGDDQLVPGDLNDGVYNGGLGGSHEQLSFCIHRAGQTGGSARIPDPGNARNDYFATPGGGQALTDLKFMQYDAGNLPPCTAACVDVGLGALSYISYAVAWDGRCQGNFGLDFHPIFKTWEYQPASGDRGAAVPKDSGIINLNAGTVSAPLIYACGRYQPISYITADVTTSDNKPYGANSWTNQSVRALFTCGAAQPYPLNGIVLGADAANLTVSSAGECRDAAGNLVPPLTFGAINIDKTPPVVKFIGNTNTYTVDQTIEINCRASDPAAADGAPASGLVSTTCQPILAGLAYTLGLGAHSFTATATDKAGNVGTATAIYNVVVTPDSLSNLAQILLGPTNPYQAQGVASFMNKAKDPAQRTAAVKGLAQYIGNESGASIFGDAAKNAQTISFLANGLLPVVVNDTDPSLQYTGAGWGYYTPRGVGDVHDDVHATTNDGDAVAYTFTGSGISFVTEKSLDEGAVDVYLDGTFQKTVNAYANVHNQAGQVLFSSGALGAGQHTLKLVKHGGAYMLLDALNVIP